MHRMLLTFLCLMTLALAGCTTPEEASADPGTSTGPNSDAAPASSKRVITMDGAAFECATTPAAGQVCDDWRRSTATAGEIAGAEKHVTSDDGSAVIDRHLYRCADGAPSGATCEKYHRTDE